MVHVLAVHLQDVGGQVTKVDGVAGEVHIDEALKSLADAFESSMYSEVSV